MGLMRCTLISGPSLGNRRSMDPVWTEKNSTGHPEFDAGGSVSGGSERTRGEIKLSNPQGDSISTVLVSNGSGADIKCTPASYGPIRGHDLGTLLSRPMLG